MARRHRDPRDVEGASPAAPELPDTALDPVWTSACSAANVLTLVALRDEPWFVAAQPIEVYEQGVELEVVVRWRSSEVWKKVPLSVDGYVVNVVLEGRRSETFTIH
jgi:hypothetical protein